MSNPSNDLAACGRLIERIAGRRLTDAESDEISTALAKVVMGLKEELDAIKGLPELARAVRMQAPTSFAAPCSICGQSTLICRGSHTT